VRTITMASVSPPVGLVEVEAPRPATAEPPSPSLSGVLRHPTCELKFPRLDGATTSYELFNRAVASFPDAECLGSRAEALPEQVTDAHGDDGEFVDRCGYAMPSVANEGEAFEFMSYSEVSARVALAASGLCGVVGPDAEQKRVAVLGANCPEAMMAVQVRPTATWEDHHWAGCGGVHRGKG
jgi:hypothetical protein